MAIELEKLSDAELDRLVMQKYQQAQPTDDLDNLSDEELNNLVMQKISQPAQQSSSPIEAGLQAFGQSASLGYLPQLQALASKGIAAITPQSEVDKQLQAQGFQIQENTPSYQQEKERFVEQGQRMAQENPIASAVGNVAGALTGGAAMGGLGAVAKTASAGQRLYSGIKAGGLVGLLENPGDTEGITDPLQIQERLTNAVKGAALGGAVQGGLEAVGSVAKTLKELPDTVKRFSELKAVKASGAMLKDFRRLMGKDKAEKLGRFMLDNKLVQGADTFESIAKKVGALKEETGAKLGDIYSKYNDELLNNFMGSKSAQSDSFKIIGKTQTGISRSVYNYLKKNINDSDISLDVFTTKGGSSYIKIRDHTYRKGQDSWTIRISDHENQFGTMKHGQPHVNLVLGNYKTVDAVRLNAKAAADDVLSRIASENPLALKKETGAKPRDIYSKKIADDMIKTQLNAVKIANDLRDEMFKELKGVSGSKAVLSRIDDELSTIAENGDNLNIKQVHEIRKNLDNLINFDKVTKDQPLLQKQLIKIRNRLNDKINERLAFFDRTFGTAKAAELKKLNQEFSMLADAEKIAVDRIARDNANQAFGLSEKIGIGSGLATGAMLGGPVGSIALGAAGAFTSKALRKYGDSSAAVLGDKVARFLAKKPIGLGSYSQKLIEAARQSPKQFISTIMLLRGEPEFKKLTKDLR